MPESKVYGLGFTVYGKKICQNRSLKVMPYSVYLTSCTPLLKRIHRHIDDLTPFPAACSNRRQGVGKGHIRKVVCL